MSVARCDRKRNLMLVVWRLSGSFEDSAGENDRAQLKWIVYGSD